MPTARVNGIDIWYEFDDAAGGRPVLVLTHGFAGPTGGWPPVVDELRAHVRLLLYDVRAHGRTTVPDPATVTMPQFAADLLGLIDHLGIDRPHVGGVSMGGMVSAQFACDYPNRLQSLMLCDTTAGNGGDRETAPAEQELVRICETQARIVEKHGLRGLVERENRYNREQNPHAAKSSYSLDEQDARNRERIERMTPAGYLAASRAMRERPDLTQRTPKIAVPTLVSCGEWDLFYPCAARDHRLIANSRLATVRGAAHDTTNYTPRLWKRAVLDFINGVETSEDIRGEVEYR